MTASKWFYLYTCSISLSRAILCLSKELWLLSSPRPREDKVKETNSYSLRVTDKPMKVFMVKIVHTIHTRLSK